MKTSYFLNFILAAALAYVAVLYVEKPVPDDMDAVVKDNSMDIILSRTSVRSYTGQAVPKEQVDSLLRAAMSAPTAMNKRPWQFVVIEDRAILDTISVKFPNISMAKDASVAVAVCGDMSLAIEGAGRDYWIQDCSAAAENLLLAANAMGLGAVWCGIYPIAERVESLSSMLGLPDNVIPLCVIPVGYPKGEPKAKDKYDKSRIHFNGY